MTLERAKFWREQSTDLLHATYVTHSFAPHTHEGYAIGVISRGVETFRYRGATHHATGGAVVLVNPGEVHTGHAETPNGWTYRMFYPEVSTLEAVGSSLGLSGTPFFPQGVVRDAALAKLMLETHATLEQSASQLERDAALSSMWRALVMRHADARGSPVHPRNDARAVSAVRNHLEANFALNTSLETLAKLAGLSGFHLTRLFTQRYGLPPHALQTQVRLRHARRKLLEGSAISAVALEVGFSDQSHLTRQFKRVYGVTPAVYARGATSKNVQDRLSRADLDFEA